jgi:integrase
MAYLKKQQYTVWLDAEGNRVPKGTPGAVQTTHESRKYYGCGIPGTGRRVPLSADKRTAEKMLAKLVERAELGGAGVPVGVAGGTALEPLIAEFSEAVARKAAPKQVRNVLKHFRQVLGGCGLTSLGDLRAAGVAARVEKFVKGLTEGEAAVTCATAAYTGKHARQFTRWLWRKREALDRDPLAGLDLPSQETTARRRPLSAAELAALLAAAENSPKPFRTVAGPDRAVLYLTAVATGYRSGELAKLTPAHFDLDAEVPVARLPGRATKNRKDAEQPIPPAVAARLRAYLVGRPADRPVWPGSWPDRAADMLRADLAAAGLPDVSGEGEAVFHSLRHSYTTMLVGVAPPQVTQQLARHSTPMLTIGRYSHANLAEKAEAVGRLPLPGADVAVGPFAHLTRNDLERTAEALLAAVCALTPLLTQGWEPAGDTVTPPETKRRRKRAA